jgi:hypothetical protein
MGMNPYLAQSAAGDLTSPRNATAISRPADTVLFASKYSTSEAKQNSFYGGWWFGPNTYFITLSIDPPNCGTNALYCAAGWGDNSFYGGNGGVKELSNVEAAGAWTGGSSLRGRLQSTIGWADGHAKSSAPGQLAAGTAYNAAKGANDIPLQSESAVVVNDYSIEHYYGNQ